jgi:predicted RNase H-like HicB family nuclease
MSYENQTNTKVIVERNISGAIQFHIEQLKEEPLRISNEQAERKMFFLPKMWRKFYV